MSIIDDKSIKTKLLRQMQESILIKQEQKDIQKQARLDEEREFVKKWQLEEEAEKRRKLMKKQSMVNDNLMEYSTHMANKQKQMENNIYDKLEKKNVSLEINHEERLGQMKEYFLKLNDKVDNNMHLYELYNNKSNTRRTPNEMIYDNYNTKNDYDYTKPKHDIEKPASPKFFPESKPIKSDVTSNFYFDKLNNRDYDQYREIQKQYLNFNKDMIGNHMKEKENMFYNKKYASVERLKDLDRYNQSIVDAKKFKSEQQNLYRYLLDNQVKTREPIYSLNNSENKIVSNPYKDRIYSLGGTILERNTIINPTPDYRYNKYLNKEARFNTLQLSGNNIIS